MKILFAVLALADCLFGQTTNLPNYSAAGIVNGASFTPGLSPNAIGTVFGTNLSWFPEVLSSSDISAGRMPTILANTQVFFNGWPAYLYYVSPTQINFLVPSSLLPGTFQFWVLRQGVRGPKVSVTLTAGSPAMFLISATQVVATHLDNSVVTSDAPASAGEIISLWANGLGATQPTLNDGMLPTAAQWLSPLDRFGISINGTAIDASLILYAGVAPGFAGLYQINVRLPDPLPPNPEIRLTLADAISPAGLILAAQ